MSCISSNFSSFFLNSLNDPSEFAKYLSNGELKFSSFEDFQMQQQQQQQHQYSTQQQINGSSSSYYNNNNNVSSTNPSNNSVSGVTAGGHNNSSTEIFNGVGPMETNTYTGAQHQPTSNQQLPPQNHPPHHFAHGHQPMHHHNHLNNLPTNSGTAMPQNYTPQRWPSGTITPNSPHANSHAPGTPNSSHTAGAGAQHFDGSFEFLKYLRHSNDYSAGSGDNSIATATTTAHPNSPSSTTPATVTTINQQQQPQQAVAGSSLIDLDSSTTHKSRSSRKVAALLSSVSRLASSNSLDSNTLDVFDHDSKHTIFDLHHHMTNSSNSNESSLEMSNLAFPNSHLNASNSNTSSEGAAAGSSDFSILNSSSSNAPKPLASFAIKENFDVHPSHKVEEGIFQHMNKLPPKKKENLKQLGVRFTGQMTLADKSIVVENFIKFCQDYDIKDHRPFLSLNQSGLNKPEQIKFARYLGQGLPTFTLFCIYSNFKNLFCTKRTEIYTKDGYNLPYILDKTKRFLSNTTADLKNMVHQQQSNDGVDFTVNNNTTTSVVNAELAKCIMPKVLENLLIYENFEVHETHRIEDGICTHITRLPPKKQEILKQFGIQSNQSVTYFEKYIIIENFIKFCNEYKIADHRPFLDFHESGLPKCEQLKFVRNLGQGLPNLTLNKIYLAFKDVLGLNRIEKITTDGYNLDMILKKKKKNLYNRMHATTVHRESTEKVRQAHYESLASEQ